MPSSRPDRCASAARRRPFDDFTETAALTTAATALTTALSAFTKSNGSIAIASLRPL
ncbi:hypothetical protein [Streptomyces sp. WMMB 322]|uniref:hypothetical protein n=1 Tax=Streptomyces sp. WMMB 322 TaxID=1286821 RepID=UPI00131BD2AF|nr:hypothetical protein [Streptomyces sp. WMMB 322]